MDQEQQGPPSRSVAPWAALTQRDFLVLWTAAFVSNSGSWMQKVATSWLVYMMTGSKVMLGIEAFVGGMTTVLLLPIGGVIADRFDRRWLLIASNVACAVIAVVLAWIAYAGRLEVWHIIAASALTGVLLAVMVPASTSLLPALVGESLVPNAIALNSLQFNLSRAIGPVLGGVSLSVFGAVGCFAANAVSFLVIVIALLLVRSLPAVPVGKLPVLGSLVEGVRYVRDRPQQLLVPIVGVASGALFGAPAVSLLPALTSDLLGRAAQSYSILVSAFGVGAMLAALAATLLGSRFSGNRTAMWLLAVVGVAQVGLAYTTTWWLSVAWVGLSGFAFVGSMIRLGTIILQSTQDLFRGRVSSLQQVAFRAGQPIGALAGGILAQWIGAGPAFALFGGLLALVSLCALFARAESVMR